MIDALWGWPPPVLDPAGPYADSVMILSWALFALGILVTAIIVAALWVALYGPPKLRRALGSERAIWIGGVAFPGIVLTLLLIWGLTLTAHLTKSITGDEMRIRVTGEMWWFRVEYLDANGIVVMREANEVRIPVGRPVVFELRSADVIHSFWIPRLSGKKDMIPGRTLLLRVEADSAGQFGGVCAEYCGGSHALMGFVAIAQDPAEWDAWFARRIAHEASAAGIGGERNSAGGGAVGRSVDDLIPPGSRPAASTLTAHAPSPSAAQFAEGRRLFMDSGCGACHRVAGTEANGLPGPDLTFMGERATVGAGILPNHRGTMIGWIGDSQAIKPGNRMPRYDRLSAHELNAIAAWLERPR